LIKNNKQIKQKANKNKINTCIDSKYNMASAESMFIQGIIIIFCLVGLYYLYQYLFGTGGQSAINLIGSSKQTAQTNPARPIIVSSSGLPPLYEGGEFSISGWIYIQNWSYRQGFNKSIITIGGVGKGSFDTIRVALGATKASLLVRLSSMLQKLSSDDQFFDTLQTDSGLLDGGSSGAGACDIQQVDSQRWVQFAISVNSSTVDTYIDGKLARSCVLNGTYKVDNAGYEARILDNGGFGGYISNMNAYNYALTPDMVYHQYMQGPMPITGILGYLQSFFTPSPQQQAQQQVQQQTQASTSTTSSTTLMLGK